MAFLGIYLIIRWTPGAQFNFGSNAFIGNLIVLAASLLFALYTIMAKPLLNYYSPNKLTAYAMYSGLLVLIPYGFLDDRTLNKTTFSPEIWLGFGYIIVVGTIAAYVFWYKGIKQTSPLKAILFYYFCPVVSMALGPFFLGEKVTSGQIGGALLVLLGLIVVKLNGFPISKIKRSLVD